MNLSHGIGNGCTKVTKRFQWKEKANIVTMAQPIHMQKETKACQQKQLKKWPKNLEFALDCNWRQWPVKDSKWQILDQHGSAQNPFCLLWILSCQDAGSVKSSALSCFWQKGVENHARIGGRSIGSLKTQIHLWYSFFNAKANFWWRNCCLIDSASTMNQSKGKQCA